MTDFLRLLKDDAYAASFQTLGQYRTALIAAYRAEEAKQVSKYTELADRLERFAATLDPNKIAGHKSQVAVMREAAISIRDLVAVAAGLGRRA